MNQKELIMMYKKRRQDLCAAVKKQHPTVTDGVLVFAAAFENSLYRFRQESSFYYYTGIHEPAVVLVLELSGKETLYVPDFGGGRGQWVTLAVDVDSNPAIFGVDSIRPLGEQMGGYAYSPVFDVRAYSWLLQDLATYAGKKTSLFYLKSKQKNLFEQHYLFEMLQQHISSHFLEEIDISPLVSLQRRVKDSYELACIKKAIAITQKAQITVAQQIQAGISERFLQAEIEKVFTQEGATRPSFPSIVACGINTTVLHYTDNVNILKSGDLLVVDIGAEYDRYAADLTRTYPVDGRYSSKQREIYQLVLDAQTEMAALAKPGMFLRNPAAKEQSLHYKVVDFFKRYGYEHYFPHSLGHFMGLDVHDVGDYAVPLMPGDVFTIEPGLYLRDYSLGVRIEDNYLMTASGAVCLSSDLKKKPHEIEELMG